MSNENTTENRPHQEAEATATNEQEQAQSGAKEGLKEKAKRIVEQAKNSELAKKGASIDFAAMKDAAKSKANELKQKAQSLNSTEETKEERDIDIEKDDIIANESAPSNLKLRVLTGAALSAVVLLLGWIDNFTVMWLFLGGVAAVALKEALGLYKIDSSLPFYWLAILWFLAYLYPNPDDLFYLTAVVFGAAIAYKQDFQKQLLLPFLYPVAGILFFLTLYNDFGMSAIIWLIVTVASTDIGAYFVGRTIGKRPFSATSPNKTLEGVVGGVVISIALGIYFGMQIASFQTVFWVTLFVSVASVFGDLFESYLKRNAGVKDSGSILPGHGGVLDRIDGYMFAAPMMVIALRAFL